jgi:hypothetical protein
MLQSENIEHFWTEMGELQAAEAREAGGQSWKLIEEEEDPRPFS